jgi:hypothetical protein
VKGTVVVASWPAGERENEGVRFGRGRGAVFRRGRTRAGQRATHAVGGPDGQQRPGAMEAGAGPRDRVRGGENWGIDKWTRSCLKRVQTDSNTIQMISNPIKLHSIQPGPSRGQKN